MDASVEYYHFASFYYLIVRIIKVLELHLAAIMIKNLKTHTRGNF